MSRPKERIDGGSTVQQLVLFSFWNQSRLDHVWRKILECIHQGIVENGKRLALVGL